MNILNFILISLLTCLHVALSIDTATVSITAAVEYAIEPACVQSCVYYNSFGVADYLLFGLGCTSTIYNECYCTQIADQSASTILSSCVNTKCQGTTEISNAISLYESYCAGAGYPRSAAAQTTPAGSSSTPASQSAISTPISSSSTTAAIVASSTATTPSTSSPSSSSSSPPISSSSNAPSPSTPPSSGSTTSPTKHKSKSKTGPIVGGVVGGLAFIALVIGIIFFYFRRRNQKSAPVPHQEAAATFPPQELSEKGRVSPVSPVSADDKKTEIQDKENQALAAVAPIDSKSPAEVQGNSGYYGRKPEELDSNGGRASELHGDGRHINNAELP